MALAIINVAEAGKAVSEFLKIQGRDFDVVVLPNGSTYGQMMVEEDPLSEGTVRARDEYCKRTRAQVLARPTVFCCPDYSFTYFGDVSGIGMQDGGSIVTKQIHSLVRGDYYYRYPNGRYAPVKVPVVRYKKSETPSWIVLHHELGYVK